jgi:hypothetical protein
MSVKVWRVFFEWNHLLNFLQMVMANCFSSFPTSIREFKIQPKVYCFVLIALAFGGIWFLRSQTNFVGEFAISLSFVAVIFREELV